MEENTVLNKPKSSLVKKTFKLVLWFFLIIFLVIATLVGLLFIYENEVKAAIVTELNKHLKSEVKIDPKNIDLTIISTFPDCSIQFKDLLMLEALPIKKRDTLLFAGQLNLLFNVKDLWNKNYEIKAIKLKDGIAKLRILKDGKTNYTFWDDGKNEPGTKKDSISFNLRLIHLERCRVSFKDKKRLIKTEVDVKNIDLKGRFYDADFQLGSEANLYVHEVNQGKNTFLKNKDLRISVDMDVVKNTYTFKKADILLNQMLLNLKGKFSYSDSLENLNLTYSAPDLDIASVLSLLPEKFKDKINEYESTGHFYAEGKVLYKSRRSYSVISDFGIKKATVTYKPGNTSAQNVNLVGRFELTQASSLLDLKNIYLGLKDDEIKGNCLIRNLENPFIRCSAQSNIHLENLQAFWPIDTLTSLKGILSLNAEVEGLLRDLKNETFSDKVRINLLAGITSLEARFKGDEKLYAVEHCSISAMNREIEIKDLKLKRGSSDITLNGKIPGVFNYIMDRTSPLVIAGSLYSERLVMEDFITPSKGNSEGNEKPLIPANMQFSLHAAILKFEFGKFKAESITGDIEIRNQKAIISDVKLQTMQGEAEINAFADNSKNRLDVVLQSTLKNINVSELFSQMNNFGQSTLSETNLKGLATATVDFSGSWNNRLVSDLKSIQSTCNINIDQGELIDFKPLLSLSKFVEVQELKRIRFSSLQSKIDIRNSIITIPRTVIKNSALNIEVWGTHTFNNEIDYHIQLLISELIAKKRKKNDSEFGPLEHDTENRRSAFLLMTGTIDNPIIKYDRKGLKEKIKMDIKQEKQTIKQLLKEEFGLFKKDSLRRREKEETSFELEKPESSPTKKTLEPKKKKEEEDDF